MMTDQDVSPVLERPVTVKAFGITDKGKVRPNNEDQFLIAELTKSMRVCQTSLTEPRLQVGEERAHLFLVADGMGGHRAGERASALAVVAIEQFTLNTFKWFFGTDSTQTQKVLAQFQSALSQADVRILEEAVEHPELSGMETTVTMASIWIRRPRCSSAPQPWQRPRIGASSQECATGTRASKDVHSFHDCSDDWTTGAQRALPMRFGPQIQTLLPREGRRPG